MEEEEMVYYIIALLVIAVDQLTKWLIVKTMELGESIEIIANFLYITSHRNKGAAFGILQGQMTFFYIITTIVVIFLVFYIQKEGMKNRFLGYSLALMLGGAIGNFIDRVFRGEVVDFIDMYFFTYDYPIFNVADSALVIGVIMIIIKMLKDERAAKGKNKNGAV